MKLRDLFLLLLVLLVWGVNFVVIRVGLNGFPPLLLCALRFGLAALPGVFFVRRPKAPLVYVVSYGFFMFALQFALLFTAIHQGLSPGLAALVLQVQAFFSMGLAAIFFHDRPSLWKICGALISFTGIFVVGSYIGGETTLMGLVLALLAALCFAAGNMFSKKVDTPSPLSLVVWGSLVALPPIVVLSFVFEGPALITESLQNVRWTTICALLYLVYVSTHLGYSLWGTLLNRYSTATVVPFTLLIPVFGFLSSSFFLGEALPAWKIVASLFVLAGLAFNLLEKQARKQMKFFASAVRAVLPSRHRDEL